MKDHSYVVILFTFGSLIIGALIRHMLKHSKIPYTVWLLLLGVWIGFMTNVYGMALGAITQSAVIVSNMDPHLMLFMFLPPLIFESAFSIDTSIFFKTMKKALLLAVPGLLMSVLLIGGLTKYVMYPDWLWEECFLLGAVLSATDPVAVVALLKTLGASKVLSSLIESESLLNDGTAIVIFTTLLRAVDEGGLSQGFGEILFTFSYMSIGGVVFGTMCGAIALYWLSNVFNDAAVEITVSLSAAYLAFYFAEADLKVSGVLAVVAFGICFSRYGATKVSPEVQHFLHDFWHMLEYLANTLIFVLTGVIIVLKNTKPTWEDWMNLGITCMGIYVIRTMIMFMFLPVFQRMKYGFSWKDAIICSWGGLRGAVGLALALVIHLDEKIPKSHREAFLFQVAGVVLVTLIINGSTMGILIQQLGVIKTSAVQMQLRHKAWNKLNEQMQIDVERLKKSPFYSNSNWNLVRQLTTLKSIQNTNTTAPKTTKPGIVIPSEEASSKTHYAVWCEMRSRVLLSLKTCFYDQYEEGMIGPHALDQLLRATTIALDSESCKTILEWEQFSKENDLVQHRKLLYIPILRKLALNRMYSRLAFAVDVANGFRYAHETVLKFLSESHFANELDMLSRVQDAMQVEVDAAQTALYDMYNIFPEIYVSISSKHAARMLLHNQRSSINKMCHKGLISEDEASDWIREIEGQMKKLMFIPSLIHLPSKSDILREIPWIKNLSSNAFRALSAAAAPVVYSKNDFLVRQHDVGQEVFIISRGVVSILFNYKLKSVRISDIGVGATIGEMSLLKGTERSSSVQAQGTVLAFRISFNDMYRIMQSEPKVEANIWQHACYHMTENMLHLIPKYSILAGARGKLRRYAKKWELVKVGGDEEIPTEKNGSKCTGKTFLLNRPLILLHGIAIQYAIGTNVRLSTMDRKVFDPLENVKRGKIISPPAPSGAYALAKNQKLAIKSGRSLGRGRATMTASNMAEGGIGEHEAPAYFPEMEKQAVFVLKNSRVMLGPTGDSHMDTENHNTAMWMGLLMNIPWIRKSGEAFAKYLISCAEDKVQHVGHSFIVNKTKAESFYIVLEGWVSISAVIDGRQVIVDTKGVGSCIGELGYLTGEIRNATVTAKTLVKTLVVMYDDLKCAEDTFPNIEKHLWFQSASTVARGVLRSTEQFKQLDKDAMVKWVSTFELLEPDDSMQGENTKNLPPTFVIVYGGATLHDSVDRVDRVFAPVALFAPNFRPEVSHIFFHESSRIMIPT